MNKKIIAAACVILAVFLMFCSCGSQPDGRELTEPSSESEVTLPPDAGDKGYADYALNYASDKIKEYDFSKYEAVTVDNPYYAEYKVTQDSDGNVRAVGYNENGDAVFVSTELYEDGEQLLYMSQTNGKTDCLIINHPSGQIVFTFDGGEFVEYSLTIKREGYNTEVRHYDNNGLTNTEVFDISGNKISG